MERLAVLLPHLERDIPLPQAAAEAGIPLRTVQRWLTRYRTEGVDGLARKERQDAGKPRLRSELVKLIEGLGLERPRKTAAVIHRRVAEAARQRDWPVPSYSAVHGILARLDPAMVTLAQDGAAAYRDHYELIYRHRADGPNALWQADHTQLDILVVNTDGKPVRPWLTTIIDDHSRAVAGLMVFCGAPSALNTALALRQAIWRKAEPNWPVCGIPDVLYVDHGADFTSGHIEQVAAALRIRLVHSAVARPQGRGKIERLFGTLNTELLPELPGHLVQGRPTSTPRLSLAELDRAVTGYVIGTYHARTHREIGQTPIEAWRAGAFLPRLPDSLDELDLLLVLHAEPRRVRRDGIAFEGLRYTAPALAAFVGEPVTVRYDPRDLSEIRVFHRTRFLCRAISPAHAGETVTLKDIQTARRAHRQALRAAINERVAALAEFLPGPQQSAPPPPPPAPARSRLRIYTEEDS